MSRSRPCNWCRSWFDYPTTGRGGQPPRCCSKDCYAKWDALRHRGHRDRRRMVDLVAELERFADRTALPPAGRDYLGRLGHLVERRNGAQIAADVRAWELAGRPVESTGQVPLPLTGTDDDGSG